MATHSSDTICCGCGKTLNPQQVVFQCIHCSAPFMICSECEVVSLIFHPVQHVFATGRLDVLLNNSENIQNVKDEITPCTSERHYVDCRECRTIKNILGVRYTLLDDNEYNLCFKHFNPSEQLGDKVFLKIRSLLTNVNELDWDSEMEVPWLKRPQDQLLSSARPKSPVVLRDSDEVAESPEFKKKFVRKMSKLASDMEFARQNSMYHKQPSSQRLSKFKLSALPSSMRLFSISNMKYDSPTSIQSQNNNYSGPAPVMPHPHLKQSTGLSKFMLPVHAVTLRDSNGSAKNSSLNSSVQSNYVDGDTGPTEQVIDGSSLHSSTASKDSKTTSSSLASSDDDSLDEGDDLHTITDWHTHLMTLKQRASSCPDPFERIQIISSIKEAVDDFRDFACDIVKMIIDEAYLPVDQKTIKPIDIGGVAGGEKYLHGGVFFKFAVDTHNIYGSDAFALKAASREIQGLKCIYHSHVDGLNIPIMYLIDYRGFRMIATPYSPIGSHTLTYGSADGGQTIVKIDKEINRKMKEFGIRTNLKAHYVGIRPPKKIYGPADLEVHLMEETGMALVIDTARVLPPFPPEDKISGLVFRKDPADDVDHLWATAGIIEPIELRKRTWKYDIKKFFPDIPPTESLDYEQFPLGLVFYMPQRFQKTLILNRNATAFCSKLVYGDAVCLLIAGLKGRQLYNLFRREFVVSHSKALSSDAFTQFQTDGMEKQKDELDLVAAAKRLREETIPDFVEDILAGDCQVETVEQLKREVHARGINLRFLGKVRSFIDKKKNPKLDAVVCAEMFARAEKQMIRVLMRSIKSKDLSSEDVKPVVAYFNLLFGHTSASAMHWTRDIKLIICRKFGIEALKPEELSLSVDLRQDSSWNNKAEAFAALQKYTGFYFHEGVARDLIENSKKSNALYPLTHEDFETCKPITRTWVDTAIKESFMGLESMDPSLIPTNLLPYFEAYKKEYCEEDEA
eukprot:TRINITY_DN3807_c0_g1_i2.p1 TRINITY_DN3807_c0_g1~~TRINITY_DN3807_c0_g1_i2.p1  ORF type:complete len:963 (+),score=137.13 TRINITY_DN3807_c0_g1_i2:44-2932(+)